MDRQTVLDLLRRQPFKPIVIRLSNGETHEIRHPEVAALGRSSLVIVDSETDRMVITSLLHIASVETVQAA